MNIELWELGNEVVRLRQKLAEKPPSINSSVSVFYKLNDSLKDILELINYIRDILMNSKKDPMTGSLDEVLHLKNKLQNFIDRNRELEEKLRIKTIDDRKNHSCSRGYFNCRYFGEALTLSYQEPGTDTIHTLVPACPFCDHQEKK